MRAEPSMLAQLVIAYHEKFGRHVPESALRLLAAGDLAAMLQDALATNVPLAGDRMGPGLAIRVQSARLLHRS